MPRILISVALATAALTVAPAGGQVDNGTKVEGGAGPSGRILYVTKGNRLTSIDVASGRKRVRRVPVAACGPNVYVTGGHVIFAELARTRTTVFSVPVALDRRPTRLGSAHFFMPSETDGRMWLAGTYCRQRGVVGVKEVTVQGEVTQRSERRVPRGWVAGAVADGLVIHRRRTAYVWHPATGRSERPLPVEGVLAVGRGRLLGCVPGTHCRRTLILDLGSRRAVAPRLGAGQRLDSAGEFSPDGSLMAAAVLAKRRWSGVAVVDTRNGDAELIPGSATGRAYPDMAWSASSGWIYWRGPDRRVMAYRPGEPRALALPFRLPRDAVYLLAG
jgi:hypothetical protein